MKPARGFLLAASLGFLFLFALPKGVSAQNVRSDWWVANGVVRAMGLAPTGDTLYIGGDFDRLGEPMGNRIPVDKTTGLPAPSFPTVAGGAVTQQVADGSGGWFILGGFAWVDGEPRNGLAHILSDGSLSPWDPNPDSAPTTMALVGSVLYVGGTFTQIGGAARDNVAAIDANSGLATPWDPSADGWVYRLVANPASVYISGLFSNAGGQPRFILAEIDPATGLATSWDPAPSSIIQSMALDDTTLYIGGNFTTVAGMPRSKIAAFSTVTGGLTAWDPSSSGPPYVITVHDTTVYIGGNFTNVDGQFRRYLASIGRSSGVPTSWYPAPDNIVDAIEVDGSDVYVGGDFKNIGGQPRNFAASIDASTALATVWDPNPSSQVVSIAMDGSNVILGGSLTFVGGLARSRLAAIDVNTGLPTSWAPGADDNVYALAIDWPTVYVGGTFLNVGGSARTSLAALDPVTGLATSWDPATAPHPPGSFDGVKAILPYGGQVYAGGGFTSIGGQVRAGLAALDPVTAAASAWDPNPLDNPRVEALYAVGDTIYVGGSFRGIGGQPRNGLAAISLTTGMAGAFDAQLMEYNVPLAIVGNDSTLFVRGDFFQIGGLTLEGVAALHPSTGLAKGWDPQFDGNPLAPGALALQGDVLYVGGRASKYGGSAQRPLVALDAKSAALLPWDPDIGFSETHSLLADGGTLYLGGYHLSAGPFPQSYITAIDAFTLVNASLRGLPSGLGFTLGPNPARGPLDLRFVLPESGHVVARVFDVSGRSVRTVADGLFEAGANRLVWNGLDSRGVRVRAGVYFVELRAGGQRATRRAVLLD